MVTRGEELTRQRRDEGRRMVKGGRRVARERHVKGNARRRRAGGDVNERDKSGQQMKRKRKEKTNLVAAANCIAFMSKRVRLARIREKRGLVHLSEHESDPG